MEFSRQEYRNRFLFPSPGNLPDPGKKPLPPVVPALAARLFATGKAPLPGEAPYCHSNKNEK